MKSFLTISDPTEGFLKDRGSKFLSFSFPVISEEEIKANLELLRSQYHDARHHCYAWVLGIDHQTYRSNDDGEPSHAAGDPILGQIRSYHLTNILVVVIRYFGGTKLGRPGLINAYRLAAEDALKKATKKEVFEVVSVKLRFGYDDLSKVERLVADLQMEVIQRRYTATCELNGLIKKELMHVLKQELRDYFGVKIEFGS